jgi:hypothetical protein
MRTAELETILRDRLMAAGLGTAMNEEKSQFLDLSDAFFAEIVLNDGSKLALTEQIVRNVKEELKEKGVQLDSVVRAVWSVKDIQFIGPARGVSGGLRAALEFEAVLESGSRDRTVSVEVTLAALNKLREKFGLSERVGSPSWVREGDVHEQTLKKLVGEFLDFQLSSGGTSYWDPILFPRRELTEPAVSYLVPDSKDFKQLRAAIDDLLGDYAVEYSLRDLASRNVHIRDFERVLPDLSSHLGGAYKPGEPFAVSALTLFQALGDLERKRLRQYYSRKVEEIPEELKQKYPRIFSN